MEPLEIRPLAAYVANPSLMQPPPAIVAGLLYEARVTLLSGREKKAGKSTFAAAMLSAVSRGVPFLGQPTKRKQGLWLAEEALGDVARRFVALGADPEWIDIAALPYAGTPADRVQQIDEAVQGRDYEWIAADTISVLQAGMKSHNDSAEMIALMHPLVQIAREREIALFLLAHANRSGDQEYRGSTEVGARVDVIAALTEGASPSQRKLSIKGRFGVDELTIAYDGAGTFSMAGGELPVEMRTLEFIVLNPGALSGEIERGVGGRAVAVREAIKTLTRTGKIDRRLERRGGRAVHAHFPRGFGVVTTEQNPGGMVQLAPNHPVPSDSENPCGGRLLGVGTSESDPHAESVGDGAGRLVTVAGTDSGRNRTRPVVPPPPDVVRGGTDGQLGMEELGHSPLRVPESVRGPNGEDAGGNPVW